MLEAIRNTLRYYITIVELVKLTDEELGHLNLKRGDVVHVALKQYWKDNG